MAHAQKPDLVFQRKGRVHLNRRGCQFSRVLSVEECGSADSNCIDRVPTYSARLLATHSIHIFPLHFPRPCVTVCHQVPNVLYPAVSERSPSPAVSVTPWCRVLEKLTGLQLVKKFPTFHGTRRFITCSNLHCSVSKVLKQ